MDKLLEYDKDFINNEDIESFREALFDVAEVRDSLNFVHKNDSSVEKIESISDWTPVHEYIKDYKSLSKGSPDKNSLSYQLLRWPILFFAVSWIGFLLILYLTVRFFISFSEWLVLITSKNSKLISSLNSSKNYGEWKKTAAKLDEQLGLDKWKEDPTLSYYDYKTILKITANLQRHIRNNDVESCMIVLQTCLTNNFAGLENVELYSQTYFGTKELVYRYKYQIIESLKLIYNSDKVTEETKYKFFKVINKNYGRTCLCLSGGACFAYLHFGIIKALVDNNLLPNIISGTSGGGLVAALAGTRTNDELKKIIIPELAYKITACEDSIFTWLPRWWKTGARFDSIAWAKKVQWFTKGSTSFQEVFERTGKILNISTVPSDPHSPAILCNNVTSPDCVVWSTLLASSAVPGILNPVVLMTKNKRTKKIEPFSFGSKWKDGSLRTDIPVDALNNYFNTKFSIVSQVNPHISLFLFDSQGSVGKPIYTNMKHQLKFRGGFVGSAIENFLKLEIKKWLKFLKQLSLIPRILNQDWSNLWLQRFGGTITLWTKMNVWDLWFILSDPTVSRMEDYIKRGELAAYPTLEFIKNRLDVENEISKGYLSLKEGHLLNNKLMRDQNKSGHDHVQSDEENQIYGNDETNIEHYDDDIQSLVSLSDGGSNDPKEVFHTPLNGSFIDS